jgi:hypothetical protein
MPSNARSDSGERAEPPEALDLERGLPSSPADTMALRHLRDQARPISTVGFLTFLARLGPADREALRSRPGPRGLPFRL